MCAGSRVPARNDEGQKRGFSPLSAHGPNLQAEPRWTVAQGARRPAGTPHLQSNAIPQSCVIGEQAGDFKISCLLPEIYSGRFSA